MYDEHREHPHAWDDSTCVRDWQAEFVAIMTHLDAFCPAEIEYWRVEFDNADTA